MFHVSASSASTINQNDNLASWYIYNALGGVPKITRLNISKEPVKRGIVTAYVFHMQKPGCWRETLFGNNEVKWRIWGYKTSFKVLQTIFLICSDLLEGDIGFSVDNGMILIGQFSPLRATNWVVYPSLWYILIIYYEIEICYTF